MDTILHTLLWLVCAGLIFYLIWWFVQWVGTPEPFRKVIKVLLGLGALIVLINAVSRLMGRPLL